MSCDDSRHHDGDPSDPTGPASERDPEETDAFLFQAAFADGDRPDGTAPAFPPDLVMPSGTALPGDDLGPYRLEEEIGRGGQGVVFRAVHTRTGRTVAIKILRDLGPQPERTLAYFKREAEIAARLDHPGLCPVYDAEIAAGIPYLSMRFLEGESLAARLSATRNRTTSLPSTCLVLDSSGTPGDDADAPSTGAPTTARDDLLTLVRVIESAARALHVAHEAGIVHRDIKPANIMITPDQEPVIMDFGLARGDERDFANLTQSGDVFGTPHYMSPEQLTTTASSLDRRTDVWSLGVTLYECLTLRRPFDGSTRDAIYHGVRNEEPPAPRRLNRMIGKDLETVLLTAMAKQRDRRYQTALAFAEDLRRVRCFEPIAAKPVTRWTKVVRWTQRNPSLAGSLSLALVAIVIGGVASWFQAREAQRHLTEWERLADGRRLADLVEAANTTLWPIAPELAPTMVNWLQEAERLIGALPEHEAALQALRDRAQPWSDADRERDARIQDIDRMRAATIDQEEADLARRYDNLGKQMADLARQREEIDQTDPSPRDERRLEQMDALRLRIDRSRETLTHMRRELAEERARISKELGRRLTYRFDDPRDQIRHDGLRDIVDGLRGLQRDHHPDRVTVAGMRVRLELARTIDERSIGQHADAWTAAIARIKKNPRYAGLELRPQRGLVPVGPDPDSNLEEFVHIGTGEIPGRGVDGELEFDRRHGIVLVLLPGATYSMGSRIEDDSDADPSQMSALPRHDIRLDPFFLSKYELTQSQWQRMRRRNPSTFTPRVASVDFTNPVTNVSWVEFAETLRRAGLLIPTEAQWEYGCRAGTDTPWSTGADPESLRGKVNIADKSSVELGYTFGMTPMFADYDDGHPVHAPATKFQPNPFGLHHMHGNVWEWCRDWHRPYDAFVARPGDGFRGAVGTMGRILRGGSYRSEPKQCISSFRSVARPGLEDHETGVRPSRAIDR